MCKPIIEAKELAAILNDESLVIIDAGNGPNAAAAYATKHVANALHIDLNSQLAAIGEDAAKGGRHPLPSSRRFTETLNNMGISNNSHVVIYDDKNGANAAARFWWMLRSIGHDKVQVLNGGLQAAEKEGLPMNAAMVVPRQADPYQSKGWQLPQVTIDEVEKMAQDNNYMVIDVRDAYRYNGESEPIDLVAGHIPGAINIPFSENLTEEGLFKPSALLRRQYQDVLQDIPLKNVVLHCGSGVTACHSILAMAQAGLEIPALYVGSWSEWSRNDKPVAKEI